MSNIEETKSLMNELGVIPKKSLGQNFLIGQSVIDKIISRVQSFSPTQVIEVGPGLGALTQQLQKDYDNLVLIELDNKFAQYWAEQGLNVIGEDALKVDWEKLNLASGSCLVSNLPYQISSSLVIERSFEPLSVQSMVLMFQKEVAQRILAKPKTKNYSLLTVIAQSFWDIDFLLEAGPNEFYPAPSIASRVLSFVRTKTEPDKDFLAFVKAAFAQRRKKLVKNLKALSYIQSESLLSQLEKMGYDNNVRAEEVSVEDFLTIYKACRNGH